MEPGLQHSSSGVCVAYILFVACSVSCLLLGKRAMGCCRFQVSVMFLVHNLETFFCKEFFIACCGRFDLPGVGFQIQDLLHCVSPIKGLCVILIVSQFPHPFSPPFCFILTNVCF